jgi:hypothetical protein
VEKGKWMKEALPDGKRKKDEGGASQWKCKKRGKGNWQSEKKLYFCSRKQKHYRK